MLICISNGKFHFCNWIRYFWGLTKDDAFGHGEGFYLGCRLEAMLAFWLSKYIFTDLLHGVVQQQLLPLAIMLAIGARLPLCSLVVFTECLTTFQMMRRKVQDIMVSPL